MVNPHQSGLFPDSVVSRVLARPSLLHVSTGQVAPSLDPNPYDLPLLAAWNAYKYQSQDCTQSQLARLAAAQTNVADLAMYQEPVYSAQLNQAQARYPLVSESTLGLQQPQDQYVPSRLSIPRSGPGMSLVYSLLTLLLVAVVLIGLPLVFVSWFI